MIKNSYLINSVRSKFDSYTAEADERKFMREQKLLENQTFSDIYYRLKAVIFDEQRAKFLNDTTKMKALSQEKTKLQTIKSQLLSELDNSEMKSIYHCPICKDSGIDGENYCHCFFEKLTEQANEFCEIRQKKYFSFEQDTLSAQSEQNLIYQKMKKYAENFSVNSKSLIFSGSPGTGKTFLASCIASEISNKNFNVIFVTACEFNQILLKYHLATTFDKQIYYDILTTCDLLIIDDLGTEPILKNVTLEYTLAIISERISGFKPFILTSNLSPEKLFERYGERLYSRLKGQNIVRLAFKGKDLR